MVKNLGAPSQNVERPQQVQRQYKRDRQDPAGYKEDPSDVYERIASEKRVKRARWEASEALKGKRDKYR